MILRMLVLVLALSSNLTSPLSAACERGSSLIAETGGISSVPGAAGGLQFADFFAIMPFDNPLAILAGAPVAFPENGPSNGGIIRVGPASFLLPAIGIYLVQFQASLLEPAPGSQLELSLTPGGPIANSVAGRATGTTQIVGISLVTTTTPNTILQVINPSGNTSLTLEQFAGDTTLSPVSAHLVIIRFR